MKHPVSVTSFLVFLFVIAQLIGISLVYLNIGEITTDGDQPVVQHDTTAIGDRPDVQGIDSLIFVVLGVTIGTALLLLLIKYRAFKIWKVWFLVAVWLAMSVAFGVLLPTTIAFILALILAILKVFRPNMIVHNVTEIFIYGGIAVLLAPIFDLLWMTILLLIISVYDVIAVWKSKHMVKMAEAQTESNLFAGIYVGKEKMNATVQSDAFIVRLFNGKILKSQTPKLLKVKAKSSSPKKSNVAILGGGDIAFPLLFSSVVLVWLIEDRAVAAATALGMTLIITLTATISLIGLFLYAKKGRFYPAMPVLTAGCLIGLGVLFLF